MFPNIQDIYNFIAKKRFACLSDISREFGIHISTAKDLALFLERDGKVEIVDKGVIKLIVVKSQVK